jgi:hypothetical protein
MSFLAVPLIEHIRASGCVFLLPSAESVPDNFANRKNSPCRRSITLYRVGTSVKNSISGTGRTSVLSAAHINPQLYSAKGGRRQQQFRTDGLLRGFELCGSRIAGTGRKSFSIVNFPILAHVNTRLLG